MKKAILVAGMSILLVAGSYYLKRTAECFGSTGAVDLPKVKEIWKGQSIALRFKMQRIAAPGCLKGRSSDSYQDVSCGYRIGKAASWKAAPLSVVTDSEIEYIVECQIPAISSDNAAGTKLDYYFKYSPWGRAPETQSASLAIR